jgi:molybdopterin/thiamine biosynthesis adenylyltransferase
MIVPPRQAEPAGLSPAGPDCRLLDHPDLGAAGINRLRDGGPVALAGLGTLGARVTLSLAALGVQLLLIDHGLVEPVNVGIQPYTADDLGLKKTEALRRRVQSIRADLPVACFGDQVERIGPRVLADCRLVIGAVDSFRSRLWLAQTTTHLEIPYLDLALDGTGRSLLGRVSGYDVAHGGACYACGWDDATWESVTYDEGISGCVALAMALALPSSTGSDSPATLALPGLAEVIAGIAAIQATRLLLGAERERVVDRECRINLSSGRYSEVRRSRSSHCRLSHQRWSTFLLDCRPADLTVGSLFDLATLHLGGDVSLAVYSEPLVFEAACPTCRRSVSTISLRGALSSCPNCRGTLVPLVPGIRARFRIEDVAGAVGRCWDELGLQPGGAVRATNWDGQELVFLFDAGMPRESAGDMPGTGSSIVRGSNPVPESL